MHGKMMKLFFIFQTIKNWYQMIFKQFEDCLKYVSFPPSLPNVELIWIDLIVNEIQEKLKLNHTYLQ